VQLNHIKATLKKLIRGKKKGFVELLLWLEQRGRDSVCIVRIEWAKGEWGEKDKGGHW